jgi:catechol 2,3-dioxygenase-like lactoylglutathione lyase family enzyme
MPQVQGVHHVALTVTDLVRSVEWYTRVFGANKLAEMELFEGHPIVLNALGPVLVGLHRDKRVNAGDRFDEFRIGLDHLSFHANNRAEVEAWASKLDELGIEHAPIADEAYGHVLVFRDPDNIQLEVMAPPDEERGPAQDDAPMVRGVSHVALTVSDAGASADWYRRVFGLGDAIASMQEEEFAFQMFLVGENALALSSKRATPSGDRFTEFRSGLDHLGYGCGGRAEVEEWATHLDGLGIEHSGVMDAGYGFVLVFRDPDNVQLEIFGNPG